MGEESPETGTDPGKAFFALSLLIFIVSTVAGIAFFFVYGSLVMTIASALAAIFSLITAGSCIVIIKQWENGVVLKFGKYSRLLTPGLKFRVPIVEGVWKVKLYDRSFDVRGQEVITRDNVSVKIDAVLFMRVIDAPKSVIQVENYVPVVKNLAQTVLRNIVGKMELDEVLSERETIASEIKRDVDIVADRWGIDVFRVELQDIVLPQDMKRAMAVQAEAEREARAIVITAKGEVEASKKYAEAAKILSETPEGIGMRLRELVTVADVSKDQSNTIFFFPVGMGTEAMTAGLGLAAAEAKEGARKSSKAQTK